MVRLICFAALVVFACKNNKSEPAAPEPRSVELQGHRGARGLAPENTVAGVRAALAVGVDTIEVDVHLSADGIPVVYHDAELNPAITRGPDGAWVEPGVAVGSLTAAELATYDVGRARPGSKHARRFPRARPPAEPEPIPTLDALIGDAERLTGGAIRYNIETKLRPEIDDAGAAALADAVIAVIRARKIADRATVQSFDWRALSRARDQAPEIARACLTSRGVRSDTLAIGRPGPSPWTAGLDIDDHRGSVPALVEAAGCAIWSPSAFSLERAEVVEAHRRGLRVITWTVNEPADIERALEMGVDGIITDEPDRAREVMASRQLRLPKSFAAVPSEAP